MKLEHFRSNTPDNHGVPDEVIIAAAKESSIYRDAPLAGSFEADRVSALHHSRLYAPVTIIYPDGNSVVQEFIDND